MSSKFKWDSYSDQPYPIADKKYKRAERRKNLFKKLKTHLFTPMLLPLYIHSKLSKSRREIDTDRFFGIGISIDRDIDHLPEEIDEVLLRFPIWDIENIGSYTSYITENLRGKSILLNILQHREHLDSLEDKFKTVFQKFQEVGVTEFQVGNAINRTKWGFFTVDEYLDFLEVAYRVSKEFKSIKLIGSSVIDFEFENTLHTLYNRKKFLLDATSSLLYVDRRGSPESKQYRVFDLLSKIELLNSIVKFSKKSKEKIYITETNWPIKDTAPYTPTSQKEAVSLSDYSNYMVRYLLIALATGKVERVYWHQLVAHGYGLVDKDGNPYPQLEAFKTVVKLLKGRKLQSYSFKYIYELIFDGLTVYWIPEKEIEIEFKERKRVINISGEESVTEKVKISDSPIYVLEDSVE